MRVPSKAGYDRGSNVAEFWYKIVKKNTWRQHEAVKIKVGASIPVMS